MVDIDTRLEAIFAEMRVSLVFDDVTSGLSDCPGPTIAGLQMMHASTRYDAVRTEIARQKPQAKTWLKALKKERKMFTIERLSMTKANRVISCSI